MFFLKRFLIVLVVILLAVLVAIGAFPANRAVHKIILPPEIIVDRVQGNVYRGGGLIVVKIGTQFNDIDVNWQWCPSVANVRLLTWCIQAKTKGLTLDVKVSPRFTDELELLITGSEILLSHFVPPHPLLFMVKADARYFISSAIIKPLQTDIFKLLSSLESTAESLNVEIFGQKISGGVLNVRKELDGHLLANFVHEGLEVAWEIKADGAYTMVGKVKNKTKIPAALVMVLPTREPSFTFNGKWK